MDNTLDKTGHGMEHKRADKAVEFRFAKPQDIPLILRFIRELADYEDEGRGDSGICSVLP